MSAGTGTTLLPSAAALVRGSCPEAATPPRPAAAAATAAAAAVKAPLAKAGAGWLPTAAPAASGPTGSELGVEQTAHSRIAGPKLGVSWEGIRAAGPAATAAAPCSKPGLTSPLVASGGCASTGGVAAPLPTALPTADAVAAVLDLAGPC
jgi:hypothetical protein